MSPLLELFDSVAHRYGRAVDLYTDEVLHVESLREVEEQIGHMFRTYAQHHRVAVPAFAFTYGTVPQAFAGSGAAGTFVGITLAKAIGLLRYFQRTLTHPSSLTEGVAEVRGSTPISRPDRAESYMDIHVPTDPRLLALAAGLTRFALMFIAGHELGHLAQRHLPAQQEADTVLWDEEFEAPSDPHHVDQLAREMAADRFAGHVLASYILHLREQMPPTLLLHYAQFAVYSLFHVEPKRQAWVQMFFQTTHPPAPFRQLTGVAGLDTTVIDSGMVPAAQVAVLTAMSLKLALETFEAVTGRP